MDGKERMEELCLEIVEKMNRFALLNFKIFWGNAPRAQTPILGGATAPLSRPHRLGTTALRAFVPR